MATQRFSISDAVNYGWNAMTPNIGLLIPVALLAGIIISMPSIINNVITAFDAPSLFALGLTQLIGLILNIIIGIGICKVSLLLYDSQGPRVIDLFRSADVVLILNYFAGHILYSLIILGGILLFIIPGIIWAIQFRFVYLLIVDKDLGPIEALQESSRITRGAKWDLFLLGIVALGIQLAGFFCFFIGLLFTTPMIWMIDAYVYRRLAAPVQTPSGPDVSFLKPDTLPSPETDQPHNSV